MTVPCTNLMELKCRLGEYLADERPMNLDEMRNAEQVLGAAVTVVRELDRALRFGQMTPYQKTAHLTKLGQVFGL